jgi:hypothetical protein
LFELDCRRFMASVFTDCGKAFPVFAAASGHTHGGKSRPGQPAQMASGKRIARLRI